MTNNTTENPSPQRKRYEEAEEQERKEQEERAAYRAMLMTWDEWWRDCPGA